MHGEVGNVSHGWDPTLGVVQRLRGNLCNFVPGVTEVVSHVTTLQVRPLRPYPEEIFVILDEVHFFAILTNFAKRAA